jgi:hypothetical protein
MNPFVGAAWVVTMPKKSDMEEAVQKLMACGHPHNFMVELDGLRLYVSMSALECLEAKQTEVDHR